MPVLKLTQATVKNIPKPQSGQVIYFDTEIKGFGLLISGKTDARSFIIQKTMRGGKTPRLTIGRANILSVEQAREKAKKALAMFYDGVDPRFERKRIEEQQMREILAQQTQEKKLSFTLRVAVDDYLKYIRIKPATAKAYRSSIEHNLADWLDFPLKNITFDMVRERHSLITEQVPIRSSNNPLAKGYAMANSVMRILRAVWNDSRQRVPELPENPVNGLRRVWHRDIRRERHVQNSEMPKFYAAVGSLSNETHRDFIRLLLFTGLRKSEAAALSWKEVDFHDRVIRLPAWRTKASRSLNLPMSDFVFDLLQERQKKGGIYVFLSSSSRSGHIEELKGTFEKIEKTSGVNVSCHDLRRTFITVAESCEISPLALKGLVNHSLGGDVTAGYVIASAERLRKPMNVVTAKLLTLVSGKRSLSESEKGRQDH